MTPYVRHLYVKFGVAPLNVAEISTRKKEIEKREKNIGNRMVLQPFLFLKGKEISSCDQA